MSGKDQRVISSSGTSTEQRYEVVQKPIMASPHHGAQDEHLLNLSPRSAVVEVAKKDDQHLPLHNYYSPHHPAVEARKDEQYSPSHHHFSPLQATVRGLIKDEQYSRQSFSPRRATFGGERKDEQYSSSRRSSFPFQAAVGVATKDEQYSGLHHTLNPHHETAEEAQLNRDRDSDMREQHSSSHHNTIPFQAAVEGAVKDERYSCSQHNLNSHHEAAEEIRLNRDRDMREYEMCRRQDRVDHFPSSPLGGTRSQFEQRFLVDERESYHMSQPSRRNDYNEVAICRTERGYGYERNDYRHLSNSKQDYSGRRLHAHSPHGALEKNDLAVEENIDSQAARHQRQDYLLATGYRKHQQRFSPVKTQSSRKESQYYPNNMAYGNSEMEEYYEEKEMYIHKCKEDPHQSSFTSSYSDTGHQQMLIKGNLSTSSGISMRVGLTNASRDAIEPPFHEHSRENLTEPRIPREYCPRSHLDLKKDHRVGYADLKYKQRKGYGRTYSKHVDYLHENSRGHKNDPGYASNDILYREASNHDVEAPEGGYRNRPVIRDHTSGSDMVEGESSQRIRRSDVLDNYYDPRYTSADFMYGKVPQHAPYEHDQKYLRGPEPADESGFVVAEDSRRILRSCAGGTKHEPGYISNDAAYGVVHIHDQTKGGHRYLRRPAMEEPIAQSGVVEPEEYQRIQRSKAGDYEDDPNYISMDDMYRAEPDHAYLQRAVMVEPNSQTGLEGTEGSQRMYQRSAMREYDSVRDEENRNLDTLRHSEYYLDYEDPPAVSSRRSTQHDISCEHGYQPEDKMYVDDYRSYTNGRIQRERFKSTPESHLDFGTAENVKADERFMYGRPLKRKYRPDGEASGTNSESTRSRKWHATNEPHDVGGNVGYRGYRSGVGDGVQSKEQSRNKCDFYLEAEEIFDEIYRREDTVRHNSTSSFQGKWENVRKQDHQEDSRKHSWSSSHQGKWKNAQEPNRKPFESRKKHFNGYLQSECSRRYDRPLHLNKKTQNYSLQNSVDGGGIKSVSQCANLAEEEGRPTHNIVEDSEAFKQKVNGAFLIFSKKLNENTSLRKLYKDQGRSGTLFCIVCGRSASKEFQDSERLSRHAYMSLKAGSRHQHLGLFRAICVLMGWNTEVPKNVVTWKPETLPYPMAIAQREDLIIWQPIIIIHNISLSNKNHKEWKVISIDTLGALIRGLSFIKSRINICVGCPGDQSVMVVKFMATYSGLREAEKLHKYFAESGRGRGDFEEAISNMGKSDGSSSMVPKAVDGETTSESLLYGYMGIAEDLDKVDLDTKKRCKIRSKQEIQDIADAPLRTE